MKNILDQAFNRLPLLQNPEALIQQINKELKDHFEKEITPGFLIKIKTLVIEKLGPDYLIYYPLQNNHENVFVLGSDVSPEYDICRHIIGTHRHNSVFLTKDQIRSNEKNPDYQNRLTSEVIEKIKLRNFGSAFFGKKPLFAGDEFIFFPVPYELFVASMLSYPLIINSEEHPIFEYYCILINSALSALSMIENNLFGNVYPICRSMLELYIKTILFEINPHLINEYKIFRDFEIRISCCGEDFMEDFIDRYNKRKFNPSSKVEYLHFGWLDAIDDYSATNRPYSIYGILEYLEKKNLLVTDFNLSELYKLCNGYVHGNVYSSKYPLLQYFETSIIITFVVYNIFQNLFTITKATPQAHEQMLINMLKRDFPLLCEQYSNRSTENFERYYSIHKKRY